MGSYLFFSMNSLKSAFQSQGHIQICPENRIIMIIGKADVWENFFETGPILILPNKLARKKYASRFNAFGMEEWDGKYSSIDLTGLPGGSVVKV